MELDVTRMPAGQRGWARFVEQLHGIDDRSERHFLELKSDLDVTSKVGQAKIAKFVLGAANRDPERAARYFDGHALMVLGVGKNGVTGVPFAEARDLVDGVERFTGTDGPRWDFDSVKVPGSDTSVVIIVVDPPAPGGPWVCMRDGEGMKDGAVYIRADGATRTATGTELRSMITRGKISAPPVEVAVDVVGEVVNSRCDPGVLEAYVRTVRRRLEESKANAGQGGYQIPGQVREDRTLEEFDAEIAEWEQDIRSGWAEALDALVARESPAVRIRGRNLSPTFLEQVEVRVQLDAELRAVDACGSDELPTDLLPESLLTSPGSPATTPCCLWS